MPRPDARSPLQVAVDEAAEDFALTQEEWSELTGYEPRTRHYETEAPRA